MKSRGEVLAERFVQANAELIAAAEHCSDVQWRSLCIAEGWPVNVTVHHVAEDYLDVLQVIESIAMGQSAPPATRESLEERNARHAHQFAQCTKEETAALLRRNGTTVAATIRRLSDEQLTCTGQVLGQTVSAAELVDPLLVSHIRTHLTSIRAAS